MAERQTQRAGGYGSADGAVRGSAGGGGNTKDGGSATVLMLASLGLTLVMLALVLAVSGAVLARHRAQSGADLAALAAAGRAWVTGAPDCALAARVAAENGGRLAGCEGGEGGTVQVWVDVRSRLGVGGRLLGAAGGTARAGPCPAC